MVAKLKKKHNVNTNRAYVLATTHYESGWPRDNVVRSSSLYIPGQALMAYDNLNYVKNITFNKELLKRADKAVKNGVGYIPENEFEMHAVAEIPLTRDMIRIIEAQRTIDEKGKTLARRLLKRFPITEKILHQVKDDD